jgi:SAM-dependent methyltransferase
VTSRWEQTDAPRGDEYDERWRVLAAEGESVHGEADLVEALVSEFGVSRAVLDAGCGTGRVGIELQRRGFDVVGVDLDETMLATARAKQPDIDWYRSDLATVSIDRRFGAAVLAGNVMIFVAPGTEGDVLSRIAAHLEPGGLIIAGFQVRSDRLSLAEYDVAAAAAGCDFVERFATWDRAPYVNGDYAVSVHRRR